MLNDLPFLLQASLVTVSLAISSMFFGLIIGVLIALARISRNRPLYILGSAYISIIRGTPLLVQIYIVYYGLPQVGIAFDPVTSGILSLSINTGAYLSEIFRAAIQSVDKGQFEASYMLGMTHWQAMRRIIVPQCIRTAVPPIGNTYISLLKDTSLVSIVTVSELLHATALIVARTFQPFTYYLLAAVIYWVLSEIFAFVQRRLEVRVNRHVRQ
ncbi:amino acid ABC transporter permease [Paenibacillus sp. P25]|nr:amino acid ABC transporter permease [Paenibacillus sp. P25]